VIDLGTGHAPVSLAQSKHDMGLRKLGLFHGIVSTLQWPNLVGAGQPQSFTFTENRASEKSSHYTIKLHSLEGVL
jgi:hypothetical protein